jgi:hypothetical protein
MVAAAARMVSDRLKWYTRIGAGRARFAARASLAAIAPPLIAAEYLVLDCPDGDDASGLFSEAAAVVGGLAHVERWPALYSGLRVNFLDHGLYYEPAMGPNWWEYFFEPVAAGAGGAPRTVVDWEHDAFAHSVELRMPRHEAARLVEKHIIPRPVIREEVDRFCGEQLRDDFTIGVHYRGTDKWEGAPVVPFDAVADAVTTAAGGRSDWKVFVATDEQPCLEYMRKRFGGRLVARDVRRSADGRPLHKASRQRYRDGADAVVDCLLLAKTSHLVRTDSNLGLFATFFNPRLTEHMFGVRT